ncbi:hypothetical protein DLM45_07520 [Hyphomicrobium methylovorum]|uniref:sulfurtransferase n=1 Tax=Hyphomicrobium methylovorum TaxID=84 RepID=UPI0015E772F3|nr:rhodanese-like domain-containing protein [Hyphomicrobium methylovorum]MBA2126071.1 hypothetical protein [Hyphomicrobium methylovorum]
MTRSIFVGLASIFMTFPISATALELPSPLVTTQWLAENQDSVRVIDVRNDPDSFKEGGHIIGAIRVDFKTLRATATEAGIAIEDIGVPADAFQKVMRDAGVSVDQPIVLTHRSRSPDDVGYAAYLYWQLKLHGHNNVAILDGGTSKWISESREVWGEDEIVEAGNFVAHPARSEFIADTAAVEKIVQNGRTDLLDARLFEFYVGLEKRPAVSRAGHIPGAKSFPFQANLNSDGTFREKDKLAAAMRAIGLNPDRPVAPYCNTGHVAAIDWFVLHELLGYQNVSLYDGSMLAWTKHGHTAQSDIR